VNRALLELEDLRAGLGLVHDVGTDDVTGHQVGGELDAREVQVQHVGDGGDDLGLADARDAFEQHVALCQEADQSAIDDFFGADDDLTDLLADALELLGEQVDSIFDSGGHWFSRGRMARKYLLTRLR